MCPDDVGATQLKAEDRANAWWAARQPLFFAEAYHLTDYRVNLTGEHSASTIAVTDLTERPLVWPESHCVIVSVVVARSSTVDTILPPASRVTGAPKYILPRPGIDYMMMHKM